MNKKIYTSHDSVKIGLILSTVGGMLDAHTFLFRDGVFANTQTGNLVFLALSLLDFNLGKTLQFVFPMVAFAVGSALTEFIKKFLPRSSSLKWVHIILLIEILFLFILSCKHLYAFSIFLKIAISISVVCLIMEGSTSRLYEPSLIDKRLDNA